MGDACRAFQPDRRKYPKLGKANNLVHLGTLGTGNHFIEICLNTEQGGVMLYSGSRGVGKAICTFFIESAKQDMREWFLSLPDEDLAYFSRGHRPLRRLCRCGRLGAGLCRLNRRMMMTNVIRPVRCVIAKPSDAELEAVNCHHNYVGQENHFGQNVLMTREDAVRAVTGVMGIIPGSMGAKSFIVRGLGKKESFDSFSHGAERVMSRTQAKREVTVAEHVVATGGVACRKDEGVINESPRAYKPIEAVMPAQADLVEIVHTLKQVVCVKG